MDKMSKKSAVGPVEVLRSSDGGKEITSKGLNAKIAVFYLPGTVQNKKFKIDLFGSKNGFLSVKPIRH